MSDTVSTRTTTMKKAQAAADEAQATAGVGFDPAIIVGIITALLSLFGVCNKTPKEALASIQKPNFVEQFLARRECRKATTNRDDADALYAVLRDQGMKWKVADVKAMYAEAGL